MNRSEAPFNQALQRTGSAVTAPAADHRRLSTHRQVPRPLRLSLSLGSLDHSTRHALFLAHPSVADRNRMRSDFEHDLDGYG